MTAPVCELADVTKAYDAHVVLDHLDLRIMPEEIVAIMGPSGSGKSTLLNLLGLLETPTQGTVRLFGKAAPRINSRSGVAMLRHRLGYLFQNAALIDGETASSNVALAQKYAAGTRAQKAAARAAALDAVGLSALGEHKVYELSGGEQQRVAIARLLVKPCDIVLADEPTGSLDPANRDTVLEHLRRLNHIGKTVVIVTHDDHVASRCDRVISLV